jgi:PPOX class probable F420-dependent enzyme
MLGGILRWRAAAFNRSGLALAVARCVLACGKFSAQSQHLRSSPVTTSSDSFSDSKYFSLRSFKKDGGPVDTPVWFAPLEQHWVIFTDGTSYKVKRIRRNPRVQVARCDMRGKVLGPWVSGTARIVENEPERSERAYQALNAKYGLIMRLGTVMSALAGRRSRRLILEIAIDP